MKSGWGKIVSMLLVVTMLTGLVGVIPAQAAEPGTVTINVTDYFEGSYVVNGIKEATTAVERALAYAETLPPETPKVIYFPEGEYHFYEDYAPFRELYVSNTVGVGPTHKDKYIGILVEKMKNVTIDGGNSSFIYHGDITAFATIGSTNITFENFEVNHASPSVVDVTVESKVPGENAIVAYVPPAYTYTIEGTTITWKGEVGPVTKQPYWQGDNSLAYTQIYDTIGGKTWRGENKLFSGVKSIEDLGGGRLKFTYNSSSLPQVGLCFQMRNTTRTTPGAFIWESEDVTLKGLDVHFLHGFGVVGQLSKDITIDDVDFVANGGRTTAGFADFLQMSSVGGKVTVKNCDFSNPHDDPINIHGTFLSVKEVSNDNKTFLLEYRHDETGGFPQYYVGDKVDFSAKGTMVPVEGSEREVVAVENFPGDNRNLIRITLDSPVPNITGGNESYVVENVTYIPEVEITNNRFIETPTRGILVTTRKPVVIENNYFDAMGMASIFISCDAGSWYESGHTEDVTIRNNVFDRLSARDGAIFVEPTGTASRGSQVHKKMLIENNVFNLEGDVPVVNAKSVKNLIIQNNVIHRMDPDVSMELTAGNKAVTVGGTQDTKLVSRGAQRTASLYKLYGCVDVSIQNNTYDAGLNQSVILGSGTLPADVTVVGDDLKVNSNSNQKPGVGTVSYISANPAVATVDANGFVKGVSAGTAEIYAYTVSGARVFESNHLTFTVSGTSGGADAPTSVTVTSDSTGVDVSDTLALSAAVAGAEDQGVTWSVRDAVTLGSTDVAAISADGVLTAGETGVVEVVATSTANSNVYGIKIITVYAPSGTKSDLWSVDRDQGTWEIGEDNTLTIEAQSGGDWATGNGAKNIFLTEAPAGDFNFTVKLQNKTTNGYEEAGLIAFSDNENYVALERKHNGGSAKIAVVTESGGDADEDEDNRPNDTAEDAIYFKLERLGDTFKGSYSANGADWTVVRSVTNALSSGFKIGVIACNSANATPFTFGEFKVDGAPVPFQRTNTAPSATAVALTPAADKATLDYTFADEDGDLEGDSLYAWYVADSADGVYSRIAQESGKTLAFTSVLSGKYVKATVIPVDQWGRVGTPADTENGKVPAVAGDPADATLRTLEVSGVALSPSFQPDVTEYHAVIPAVAGTLPVNAVTTQPDAKVTVTQTDELITVTVTASNGTAIKTYTVSLTRAKDSRSALKTLDLTGDGASFSLEGNTRYYQLLVDSDVNTLELEASAVSAAAGLEIRFNYKPLSKYADGAEGSFTLPLSGGFNYLEIRVLGEDGVSACIYRVVFMKTPSSEAGLASLKINGVSVPGFDSETDTYRQEVSAGTATVSAVAKSGKAKVEYLLNNAITEGSVELADHLTTVQVKVTAENTSTVRYYTLHLVIPASNSTDLIHFATEGVALNPAFDPETAAYTASVSQKTLPLSVMAVESKTLLTAETASTFFRGEGELDAAIPLKDGENKVTVTVTSPDGTAVKSYTITVEKHNSVYLSDLEWVSGVAGDPSKNGGKPYKDRAWEDHDMSLTDASKEEATFAKGLGTHADSTIVYDLTGKGYKTFSAKIGVSYFKHTSNEPKLVFTVIADGETLYTSPTAMLGATPYVELDLDVTGKNELKLLMMQASNNWSAHGNWADAKFILPMETPATQYGVTVTEATNAAVWADFKEAAEGETVTIHIDNIVDGYRLAALSAKDADGAAVATTAVEEGAVYTFTMPAKAVTVSAQIEEIPSSSGGGGGTRPGDTVTNPDGSTSTTVTDKTTGTVTVTTKYQNGVKVETVTPKAGEAISTVTMPSSVSKASVFIPSAAAKPGLVAVRIKEDGTEELVKLSVSVAGGVQLALTGSAKVKLVDNTKSFADVAESHWAADAVQFVASRELFQGDDRGSFQVGGDMTRAMLVTVLARLDGQDTDGGDTWYSKASEWAADKGISDGENLNGSITREQLAAMLYRYAGEPKANGTAAAFGDAGTISPWAANAMDWAVKTGILSGDGTGKLNPTGDASRAEVATMLERFVSNTVMAK